MKKLAIFITSEEKNNYKTTTTDFVGDEELYEEFKKEVAKEFIGRL